jgi:hypothetical protein
MLYSANAGVLTRPPKLSWVSAEQESFKTKRTLFRFKGDASLEEWACETSSTVASNVVDNIGGLGLGAKDRVDLQPTEDQKGAVFTSQLYSRNIRAEMYTDIDEKVIQEIDQ